MAARRKTEVFKRKASEGILSRMICGIFGVPATDEWSAAVARVKEHDADKAMPWSVADVVLHPWQEAVASSVFKCHKGDELISTLVAAEGDVHLVQDSGLSGKEGVWLMVAEPAHLDESSAAHVLSCSAARMLVNHVFYTEATYVVVAVQLTSCLRS